jgi:hypothetical protein
MKFSVRTVLSVAILLYAETPTAGRPPLQKANQGQKSDPQTRTETEAEMAT